MTEFQKEITKAKKIFNIKENNLILNIRIIKIINELLERNPQADSTIVKQQFYDLFFILDELKKNDNCFTPFKLYKVFKLCIYGIDELLFFNDTVGSSKDYSYRKIKDIIERAKPFIINHKEIQTRIPKDPNDAYNNIYFTLLNNYNMKKEDIINLLSIVYNRNKKAKVPKRTINELKELKSIFHRIIRSGGKEKGYTKKEIEDMVSKTDKHFKDYL